MTAGLQCFDASGQLTLDVTTRLGRIIGQVQTTGSAGSLTAPGFSQGEPFFCLLPIAYPGAGASGGTVWPKVSISGQTLSWSSGSQAYLLYGVY